MEKGSPYKKCAFEFRMNGRKSDYFWRSILAVLLPFVALGIQLEIWHIVQPFAWFVFYPTLILSTWIGGFFSGLAATFISALLAWYYFISPINALLVNDPKYLFATGLFVLTGFIFSFLHSRLRRVMKLRVEAEEEL